MPLQFASYPWESAYPELWPVAGWCPSLNPYAITTLYDLTGQYNSHGTLTNFTLSTAWADPSINGLTFDGVNDFVDCGYKPSLDVMTQVTVAAWIKTTSGSIQCIFSNGLGGSQSGYAFEMGFNGATIPGCLGFWNGSSWKGTSTTVNSGSSVHVAVTNDGTNSRFYINGKLDTSVAHSAFTQQTAVKTSQKIGIREGSVQPFSGSIQEVSVYNRALVDGEIGQLAQGIGLIYTPRDDSIWNVQAATGNRRRREIICGAA